mmetsp:Transcript_1726/g.3056  ORF Transcript_1726/g.3056 Transcript_1726/m.3056 type:complete len:210 (-) Transcript_1726:484-1113(-)
MLEVLGVEAGLLAVVVVGNDEDFVGEERGEVVLAQVVRHDFLEGHPLVERAVERVVDIGDLDAEDHAEDDSNSEDHPLLRVVELHLDHLVLRQVLGQLEVLLVLRAYDVVEHQLVHLNLLQGKLQVLLLLIVDVRDELHAEGLNHLVGSNVLHEVGGLLLGQLLSSVIVEREGVGLGLLLLPLLAQTLYRLLELEEVLTLLIIVEPLLA